METKSISTINFPSIERFYNIIKYSAGEMQVRLLSPIKGDVIIHAKIKTEKDIVELAHLKSCLKDGNPNREIHLKLAYLPYSRADRRFVSGDCSGLEVFGKFIEGMDFTSVTTFDVHNLDAAEKAIKGIINVSPERQILQTIGNLTENHSAINVLFPDEGSKIRYSEMLPEYYGCNLKTVEIKILNCSKIRNPLTGELSGFITPEKEEFIPNCPILIVDDICDGGGTFVGISLSLTTKGITNEKSLYVSHGIFSKGFSELLKSFTKIFTTNSLGKFENFISATRFHIYDVSPEMNWNH